MARIHDEELQKLAQVYNTECRKGLYGMLREGYGIKNPYFVFTHMKEKEELGYIPEQDCFCAQPAPAEADGVFMSFEELCAPAVPQHAKTPAGPTTGSKPEAMEN